MKKTIRFVLVCFTLSFSMIANAHEDHFFDEWGSDDGESYMDYSVYACRSASAEQIRAVNLGNQKRDKFLSYCAQHTANSPWCQQVIRPNPDSRSTFTCTYGSSQTHQLIHPDESTWPHAVVAIQLVKEMERAGIDVCVIYNWWRPEPYNANVGGAAGRHPYGTSVDVRFCTKADQNRAFTHLCRERARGRIKALGYYPGTGLHLGVGDRVANTWGRACP